MRRAPILIVLTLLASQAIVVACDTPVWQYTMLYWEQEPYLICFFHDEQVGPADEAVNFRLQVAADRRTAGPNLAFSAIDVSDEAIALPWYLREVFEENAERPLPYHVIISPRGQPVFVGQLAEAEVEVLCDSPIRQELCTRLSAGAQGVLVVMSGADEEATQVATSAVEAAIATANAFGAAAKWLALDRTAPEEAWLVRMLLQIEPDLLEIDAPMVFGVFGRGHLLPPYVGAGITERNMEDLIVFINGPCTCEIKAQSQGVDLLTSFDWEAHMADFAPEDPIPDGFREMSVDDLLGGR